MKTFFELREKTLTPAEKKKREEVAKAIERENPSMPMAKKMAIATATAKKVAEEAELDEAVEVSHDRYMRSHGKKASGGEGNWMFTHKRMGDANVNDSKEVHTARGKFSDAKKSAQQWAKKHGHSTVYVMEEVEQIDELSKKTLGQYIKLAGHDREQRQKKATGLSQVGHEVKGQNRKQADDLFHRAGAELHKAANRKVGINKAVNKLVGEEVEQVDEISRDLARRYIRKVADKTNTGELSTKEVEKRRPGVNLAGKKAYPSIAGKARVTATEEVEKVDEVSVKTLSQYTTKAAQQGSKRVAGQWMADQKLRKRDGYSSSAKVAATSTPKKD